MSRTSHAAQIRAALALGAFTADKLALMCMLHRDSVTRVLLRLKFKHQAKVIGYLEGGRRRKQYCRIWAST